eukprot:5072755-Alexandrium_andersonii.AAC.1
MARSTIRARAMARDAVRSRPKCARAKAKGRTSAWTRANRPPRTSRKLRALGGHMRRTSQTQRCNL